MIFWSGRGIFVFFTGILSGVISILLTTLIGIDILLPSINTGLACFIEALMCWLLAKWFNKKPMLRHVNKGTLDETQYIVRDSFMFIDVKFWTYIFIVIGIVMLIKPYFV